MLSWDSLSFLDLSPVSKQCHCDYPVPCVAKADLQLGEGTGASGWNLRSNVPLHTLPEGNIKPELGECGGIGGSLGV